MLCRNLDNPKLSDVVSVVDVLEHFPRDYQKCFLDMEDGQYATILGTIIKNSSSGAYFQKTTLVVQVDPDESKKALDETNEDGPSGEHRRRPYSSSERQSTTW